MIRDHVRLQNVVIMNLLPEMANANPAKDLLLCPKMENHALSQNVQKRENLLQRVELVSNAHPT